MVWEVKVLAILPEGGIKASIQREPIRALSKVVGEGSIGVEEYRSSSTASTLAGKEVLDSPTAA